MTTASASTPIITLKTWEPVFCTCGRVVALQQPEHPSGTVKAKCKICKIWIVV